MAQEAREKRFRPAGQPSHNQENASDTPAEPSPSDPRVLVELSAHGPRIVAANASGFAAGARIGQRLHDARAAYPALRVEYADSDADAAMLERLARFAFRFCPIVAPDGLSATDAGLMLDVAGCAHLFGDEEAMVRQVVARFTALGFLTLAGLAPTRLSARALARYSHDPDEGSPPIMTAPFEEAALDSFPIEALELDEDRVTLLTRLGLKTIGSVRTLPRASLERRFRSKQEAQSVRWRLDQLTGTIADPITPMRPPEPYRTALACPEPIMDVVAVEWALRDMLARLEGRLEREGLGARRFTLTAFNVDGGSSQVAVQLSRAGRSADMVMRMFAERLENIDPGFGIEAFVLAAQGTQAMEGEQAGWVPKVVSGSDALRLDEDVMALVDRLANRFGTQIAYQLQPVASHVPEQASRFVAAGSEAQKLDWRQWQEAAQLAAPFADRRPARLLDRPEPADVVAAIPDGPPAQLVWRRVRRGIIRARGPERITAPWWQDGESNPLEDGPARVRDYYDVEDEEGRRYWVFRAGLYGEQEASGGFDRQNWQGVHWYVHGLFQ